MVRYRYLDDDEYWHAGADGWPVAMKMFEKIGAEMGIDWSSWPLFQELPILPVGEIDGPPCSRYEPYDVQFRPGQGFASAHRVWKSEAISWWPKTLYDRNIELISYNMCPIEADDYYANDCVTKSARETLRCLFAARHDRSVCMAIMVLAWLHTARKQNHSARLGGDQQRELVEFRDELNRAAVVGAGEYRPDWHHSGAWMLPAFGEYTDVLTFEAARIQSATELLQRMLTDMRRSQTEFLLVHLTTDPDFDEVKFREKLAKLREYAKASRELDAALEEARREDARKVELDIAEAWRVERTTRQERAAQYKSVGIDLGDGPMTIVDAGKCIGVPKPTITRWAQLGLSIEQMKYLAANPQRGARMDERLATAGLVPGVPTNKQTKVAT